MLLSTQYYRPPFPNRERWIEDLCEIRRTGLDAIYVTAPWAWIEPEPEKFEFDDYDYLIEQAGRAGLSTIVNLWAEIQPTWIHRHVPEGSMVDHMGRAVVSSHLAYMNFGLTPGCCTDHPHVRQLAGTFIDKVAKRYAGSSNILMWDCWNEMRWMSQSDGYVCFCEHTKERYRAWLKTKYGSLGGLNAAWNARYGNWADVVPPKLPGRSYMHGMEWQAFQSTRTKEDLRWRYNQIRGADSSRPIIAHGAFPSIHNTGEYFDYETPFNRGNDWELAECVDGYGGSHFPAWFHSASSDYGSRLEAGRCAAGNKFYWIAELQGGAAGHGLQAMPSVPGDRLARWIWNGVARGVKGVNFWCWRDEAFGRESGGFGIVGEDGHRQSRLDHLERVANMFSTHRHLLDAYVPEKARVAVIFEPRTYALDWVSHTTGGLSPSKLLPYPAGHGVQGYLRALERLQIPYDVLETNHARGMDQYDCVFFPGPLVVDSKFGEQLSNWVSGGGTLLTEAGLDSFDELGRYHSPDQRSFARALDLRPLGRRMIESPEFPFAIGRASGSLRASRWVEPQILPGIGDAADNSATAMLVERRVGNGHVVAVGSFIGVAYWEDRYADFERFVDAIVSKALREPLVECDHRDGEVVQWRFGSANQSKLLFIVNEGPETQTRWNVPATSLANLHDAEDLTARQRITLSTSDGNVRFDLRLQAGGYHLLRFS